MPRAILSGEPGSSYRNTGEKVQYQLLVDWSTCCGLCAQWDRAVSSWWGIPFHRGCNCRQQPVWPGKEAQPFVDFQQKIDALAPAQQARIIGAASLKLVRKGVVQWSDVVTPARIRSLREVVSRKGLTVQAMTGAGVLRKTAETAYKAVHTPAHEIAAADRAAAVRMLASRGPSPQAIGAAFGQRVAERLTVAPIPAMTPTPKPALTPTKPSGGTSPASRPKPRTPFVPAAVLALAAALGASVKRGAGATLARLFPGGGSREP